MPVWAARRAGRRSGHTCSYRRPVAGTAVEIGRATEPIARGVASIARRAAGHGFSFTARSWRGAGTGAVAGITAAGPRQQAPRSAPMAISGTTTGLALGGRPRRGPAQKAPRATGAGSSSSDGGSGADQARKDPARFGGGGLWLGRRRAKMRAVAGPREPRHGEG